jgi:hypothetical protein
MITKSEKSKPEWRANALFQLGKIYSEDLHDPTLAESYFTQFVSEFPQHQWAHTASHKLNKL